MAEKIPLAVPTSWGILQESDPLPEPLLTHMLDRFINKKKLYQSSGDLYHYLDRFLFSVPLLILQAVQAALPQTSQLAQSEKITITVLAAISGLWIAIQLKLKWAEDSQKYYEAARVYALLCTETHYLLSIAKAGGKVEGLLKFYDFARELEQRGRDGCPTPPSCLNREAQKSAIPV